MSGIGAKLSSINLFGPIEKHVKIHQKTVKDSPTEKLYDGFINLLCGAQGTVEVNKLVRSDRGLQRAFGRGRCAEQSVIQATLDASDAENVSQIEQAMDEIYQQHSQGYGHDYEQQLQILDVDMSGREPRIQAIIEPMLAGQELTEVPNEDIQFVLDLGLCRMDPEGGLAIANPIYREVLPRVLTFASSASLPRIAPNNVLLA